MSKDPVIVPYTGDALKKQVTLPRKNYHFDFKKQEFVGTQLKTKNEDNKEVDVTENIDPYLPDPTLMEAVELMQILERPLLLRGEPGCGKTKVAQAYAFERYGADYRRHYFEWHVKSSSKAQDGLYFFDHIARLRNAHANSNKPVKEGEPVEAEDMTLYRELGPLGEAFKASEPGDPAILLIDEIDKADIDFPNDLLLELDEMRFVIRETGEEIVPKCRPLIFITSNQERELPQAFLRRCLFHYIQFPGKDLLESIMLANFPEFEPSMNTEKPYLSVAIGKFNQLREDLKKNPTVNKNVSTSELKDWVKLLLNYFKLDPNDSRISLLDDRLPFYTALLKTENDLKSMKKFETVK